MLESDDKLFEIWKQFDFNIDPSNAETEKEKFLKNRDYSPKFEYLRVLNLEHFKKNLLNIKTDNSWIGKLIKERIENILKKVEMLSNRNNESFTKSSVQLFGKPSKETTDEAKKLLQLREELEIKNLFCTDARRIISRALVENKLRGWRVELRDDMSATAKVDSADRIVCIKTGEKFSGSGIERLIVHELQTHAFRLENARLQKYKLFQIGFPNYLVTEEGIATLNEEKAEYLLNDKIKKLYAGRIIAVNLALEKGFA
ncbi:MAG: flavohemoglobin expression-modulating QEGLA motif protein, partial [Nanoarchaeota archaeon]|nr:flavohemoglobin expression-modulating QEGLA motif protein [Nanoarchaeota archaeon]